LKENTQLVLEFPSVSGRKVIADFDGGVVTSDAGILFLREMERSVGIIDQIVSRIPDDRDKRYVDHPMRELVTQRVMQIACGYEDADDSDSLLLPSGQRRIAVRRGLWPVGRHQHGVYSHAGIVDGYALRRS
jgi:hypothetical protein